MQITDDAIYDDVLSHLESARRQLAPDQLAGPGGTCVENYEQWLDERMLDMALEELVHLGTDVDISSKNYWRELRSAARLLATSTMAQSLLPIIDKHDV